MEHVAELRHLLSLEKTGQPVALDLNDVTLVERDAVRFLSECESDSISLKNCPAYIREWIKRDKKRKQNENKEQSDELR